MTIEVPSRFADQGLYEVLGVDKSVTKAQLKKAYLKAALKYHPDHNHSADANAEFAYLAKVHEILSNDERRAVYDQTGEIDEVETQREMDPTEAAEYWRSVFPAITKQQIEEYRTKYIGSDEEAEDIAAAYVKYEGDLNSVFESVPFADASSVERIAAVLNDRCRAKLTAKQIAKFKRKLAEIEAEEEKEFNEMKQTATKEQRLLIEAPADDMSALTSVINTRAKQRESQYSSLIDSITSKYVDTEQKQTKGGKKNSKRKTEEPSEEEFEKLQAKIMARKKPKN